MLLKLVSDFATVGMPCTFSDRKCSMFQQVLAIVLQNYSLNQGVLDLWSHKSTVGLHISKGLMCFMPASSFIKKEDDQLLLCGTFLMKASGL